MRSSTINQEIDVYTRLRSTVQKRQTQVGANRHLKNLLVHSEDAKITRTVVASFTPLPICTFIYGAHASAAPHFLSPALVPPLSQTDVSWFAVPYYFVCFCLATCGTQTPAPVFVPSHRGLPSPFPLSVAEFVVELNE